MRLLGRAFLTPILALLFYFYMPFDGNRWMLSAGLGVLATIIAVAYAASRVKRIRGNVNPLAQALAVISLMLSLIVAGFAAGYYSLAINSTQFPGIHTRLDGLYFTIVTIGTVGYGDITPVGQGARAMVSLQIMLNLTLIATVIRMLARVATEGRETQIEEALEGR